MVVGMTTRTSHSVPVPDGHLAFVDEGAGHPVVLLHGGVLDHRMWEPQIEPLAVPAHYPNLEQPDAFTDAVLEFLRR